MRTVKIVLSSALMIALLSSMAAFGDMPEDGDGPKVVDATESVEIRSEILQLVNDYAIYRDRSDAKNYSSLFAVDGCLTVRGNELCGREALYQRLANADGSRVSMHVMSSSQITIIDRDNATGVHYAAVYGGARTENQEGPIPVSGFAVLGQYHDHYVRTADGWKISKRIMRPIFVTAD